MKKIEVSSVPVFLQRGDAGLYTIGNTDILTLPAVGIAGSRKVSAIGLKVTEEYVRLIASQGINIISGHASGVDLAAHRAALAAGGVTTVIPLQGLNGFQLAKDLQPALAEGRLLILSSFPPEVGFARWMPVKRNRLIAQLAHAMLVIESGEAGGTFRAAEAAQVLKRPLFVILYGGTIASAAGNSYFLERGAVPVGRTLDGRPDLAKLLATVAQQHRSGNPPWETHHEKKKDPFMSQDNDRRLIEDYLPIVAIGIEASREKSVRKGHISTLHLWWARRPLVACRAAVFGTLVGLDPFRPQNGPEEKRDNLTRANAAKFVQGLCQYPGLQTHFNQATTHILKAHAARLSAERGEAVTMQDILDGNAPRPRVLDLFAGGGAIPLEALRLGCETHALDLNPVAHIIQRATLVYPQQYGQADTHEPGMTGPKNGQGKTTWGGLADEVRYWGKFILQQAKAIMGDLYPLPPEPEGLYGGPSQQQGDMTDALELNPDVEVPPGQLLPMAYLWTRTVACKNPECRAEVPLVRQTWLNKKKGRTIAVRMIATPGEKRVKFRVVEAADQAGLGFDPGEFSKGGSASCPFCGSVVDSTYVKAEGQAGRIGHHMMAIVCNASAKRGKVYLSADDHADLIPDAATIQQRIQSYCQETGITIPDEPLEANPRSFDVQNFGFKYWRDIFTDRQMLAMLVFSSLTKGVYARQLDHDPQRAEAILVCLSMVVGKLADYCTSFCTWQPEFIVHMYDSPGLPMIMDFAEANPLAGVSGSWGSALEYVTSVLANLATTTNPAKVARGSALATNYPDQWFDAVITDPPYYDSRSYSNLADHFYIWHKRVLAHVLPEHFSTVLTPKKAEAIAAPYRHGGDRKKAALGYEDMMELAFKEACRILKPGCPMVCVYAHKTTAGWATVINAIQNAGFAIQEAWPVDMERKVRQNAQNVSALASSIFLVARKREGAATGAYESQVRPELEAIVRERVKALWEMGVAGADLVIAAVGAGLRAFTRYARVEFANGEPVPAETFLAEVEGVVLEELLKKIFGGAGSGVSAVDGPTRYYVLWRYAYKTAELEAGEAIVFTCGQHVELDGPKGLTAGRSALAEKKQGKYRLRDWTERGEEESLGLPANDTTPAPLIDVLHRILWILENRPRKLAEFLAEARPAKERLRVVAQALSGAALTGKTGEDADRFATTTPEEHATLIKLLANWKALMDNGLGVMGKPTLDFGD